ncbi:MAG: hypothetical protein QOJ49_1492 [Actinomycetota bacterium]|jgi:hypothetical protein|nr:hypothetical protein [Actinomycetota bacterium]
MTSDADPVPGMSYEARTNAAAGRERTPAEIEAEIEQTRVRLAGTVDAIADRVKPANVARRGVEAARAQVVDERGQPRTARIAALAVAALAVGVILFRRRSR